MIAASHEHQSGGRLPVVLIVDDERQNLLALCRFFRKRGCRPHLFTDARVALEKVRKGVKPALILSDYRMPVMDGLQFVEGLRAAGNEAPIILLTAHGDVDSYFKALSLGVFEFIHKPVRDVELERVIGMALKGGQRRQAH